MKNIGMKMTFMQTNEPKKWILPSVCSSSAVAFGTSNRSREEGEDRPRRDDVVEVADDVVRVVQRDVRDVEGERKPREPADAEHREKADAKSMGVLKADRSTPQRDDRAVRITTDGIEMIIVVVWKNAAIVVPYPS